MTANFVNDCRSAQYCTRRLFPHRARFGGLIQRVAGYLMALSNTFNSKENGGIRGNTQQQELLRRPLRTSWRSAQNSSPTKKPRSSRMARVSRTPAARWAVVRSAAAERRPANRPPAACASRCAGLLSPPPLRFTRTSRTSSRSDRSSPASLEQRMMSAHAANGLASLSHWISSRPPSGRL
jgi:hypothetical protein